MIQHNLFHKDSDPYELIGSENEGYDEILISKYPQVPQENFYCLQHPPFYLTSAPSSTALAASQMYGNIAAGKNASQSKKGAASSGLADHDTMSCCGRKGLCSNISWQRHHHHHQQPQRGGKRERAPQKLSASHSALDSLSLESDDTVISSSWSSDAPATTSVATVSTVGGQRGMSECVKNVAKWMTYVGRKVGRGASVIKESFPNLKEYHVVMIGLDGAGKTTLLYRLKFDQYINAVPTIGFNCERVRAPPMSRTTDVPKSSASSPEEVPTPSRGHVSFLVWDVGGQEKLRPLWRPYTRATDGVIFVVDSTDPHERLEEAKLELHAIMSRTAGNALVPLLVVANKQDLPLARPVDQVASLLGLSELKQLRHIQSVCATTGDGLDLAMQRLHSMITERRKVKAKRERNKTR